MRSLLVLLCLLVGDPSLWALTYDITDLGTLGGTSSVAYGINDHGDVAGYSEPASGAARAFRWSEGAGMTSLGTLGGSGSEAWSINNSGQISGLSQDAAAHWQAFRWQGGVMSDIGALAGVSYSQGPDINEGGQVVGVALLGDNYYHATLFETDGSMRDLGYFSGAPLPAHYQAVSAATGINDLEEVSGYGIHKDYTESAFVWSEADGVISLGTLGGDTSAAWGISNSGSVVGDSRNSAGQRHAFIWSDSTGMVDLGTLGGYSYAFSLNEVGQVVGWSETPTEEVHAVLYQDGQCLDLNGLIDAQSGWSLSRAFDINEAGYIVGDGMLGGEQHAFLLSPQPPELTWLGIGDYMSDGVGPDTGQPVSSPSPTTFLFKVKYTDGTGNPPLRAQCVLQKRVCTAWNRYQNVAMTKESGDIATGAIYSCSRQLPNEAFRYRFRFRAADGTWLTGDPPCHFAQGPMITGRPKLCWSGRPGYTTDGVQPDSGPPGTKFKFQVLYHDSAGNAPDVHMLLIRRNGRMYAKQTMRALAAGDFRMGKRYQRRVRIRKPGTYEYRFRFRDASGVATGAPNGWHPGPVITGGSVSPVAVSSLVAMPTNEGAQISFSLSSAGQVRARILNLTGRAVRTLCHAQDCDAGTNTLLWNAQSDQGLPVPNGTYLVEVTAKAADGGQARALGQVRVRR